MIDLPKAGNDADFASAIALRFAKNNGMSPMDFAYEVIEKISLTNSIFENVDAAQPGFLNFTIKNSAFESQIAKSTEIEKVASGEKVAIDYSSPNIAKKMHIAHLRSTAIGDSIKRVYKEVEAKYLWKTD